MAAHYGFAGRPIDRCVRVPLAVPTLKLGRTHQVVTLQYLYYIKQFIDVGTKLTKDLMFLKCI